jgi:hypothetical protein
MPDYLAKARQLRVKAADPAVPKPEREALEKKARELETKYGKVNFPFTDDTTVTDRSGGAEGDLFTNGAWIYYPKPDPMNRATATYWAEYLQKLAENQWQWNTEYYDKDGNPRVQEEEDIVEEEYRYDEEESDY